MGWRTQQGSGPHNVSDGLARKGRTRDWGLQIPVSSYRCPSGPRCSELPGHSLRDPSTTFNLIRSVTDVINAISAHAPSLSGGGLKVSEESIQGPHSRHAGTTDGERRHSAAKNTSFLALIPTGHGGSTMRLAFRKDDSPPVLEVSQVPLRAARNVSRSLY
ncbi:hypothetical protein VUR80DRAFT_2583 [Thermomyces stellatus]